MARASASVVGSGAVGPEPITAGSSPGTSEIATVTRRAGGAWGARVAPPVRGRGRRGGAGEPRGIGHRMAGFDHAHAPGRPAIADARHRDPGQALGRNTAL